MAVITAQASAANAALTYAAATAGGDTVTIGSAQRCTILVRNASAGSITLTVTAVNACSQGVLHNLVVTCPVGDTEVAVTSNYVSSSGQVALTYSAATSVTVAAVTS
ncbi:MAG: hypothetical protein NVSMB4_04160 [Acidimicrobiales bacterium]